MLNVKYDNIPLYSSPPIHHFQTLIMAVPNVQVYKIILYIHLEQINISDYV